MSHWPIVPIFNACDLANRRVTPFPGSRPYVSTGDVESTNITHSTLVTYENRPSRADLCVKEGDVLFARMQATDKVVLVKPEMEQYLWSTGFASLRPKPTLNRRWLMYWLRSHFFTERKDALCSGATQKAITNDSISELTIPLAPINEQERIVQILDDADSLNILHAEVMHRLSQVIPSVFDYLFGDPQKNIKKWPIVKLGDIAQLERGRFTPRPRNDPSYFDGDYPFIQTGDISDSDGLLSTYKQTLNERGKNVSKEFPAGTIVIAIVGATIGATAILQIPVYCTDSIVGINVNHKFCYTEFVEFYLRSRRPSLLAQAPDAARANLNLEILRNIQIPLPPLEAQSIFVEYVGYIRTLQSLQKSNGRRLDNLFRSLLHRAFQGDL